MPKLKENDQNRVKTHRVSGRLSRVSTHGQPREDGHNPSVKDTHIWITNLLNEYAQLKDDKVRLEHQLDIANARLKTKQPRNKKIPKFDSIQEEASFWDVYSPLDFPEQISETKIEVEKPLKHERIVSLRLDDPTFHVIDEIARRRHIGFSSLIRMFILQELERINPK